MLALLVVYEGLDQAPSTSADVSNMAETYGLLTFMMSARRGFHFFGSLLQRITYLENHVGDCTAVLVTLVEPENGKPRHFQPDPDVRDLLGSASAFPPCASCRGTPRYRVNSRNLRANTSMT